MLTERERFLMREAWNTSSNCFYDSFDQWLDDRIDDAGHTIEHVLVFDADRIAPKARE